MSEFSQAAWHKLLVFWREAKASLTLGRGELLVEQLRLIYASMTMSVLPMFPAILLVVYTIYTEGNRKPLLTWMVAAIATNAFSMFDARRHLARGFTAQEAPALVRRLFISLAIAGFVWGGLIWGALGRSTEIGNWMVIGIIAGILGGGLALLSPIFPAFLAFSLPLIGATVLGLWTNPDPAHRAFGVVAVLYLLALIGQARMSSLSARAAVELRFENLALVRKEHEARLAAEEANQAKSAFLAAASHDLRQPIHAQGLFLDVLERTELTAQQQRLVSQVSAAREATAEMLNVLLDFSRIEAGVLKPEIRAFDARHLLNKLEREFASEADLKGLEYRSREPVLMLYSDPGLVELILRNLISNAIRYTEQGGVLVTCRERAGLAVLSVYDTGIGIAPQHQADVYKAFKQLGNPERDRRKGLGLGLAIVQKLASSLDHPLALKSVVGRGSVFELSLPIAKHQPRAERISAVELPGAGKSSGASAAQLSARVLVIDDEANVRDGMVAVLESWGCVCATAEGIAQATAVAPGFAPTVVISDYRLRDFETGLDAIAAVRQALGHEVTALLITGDTAPDRLREATGSGIPLLHKPVAPHALLAALQRVLPQS